ncbi:uncharacterized protein PG998_013175 [Apiospora kogelbergensis]|uniref:uncharacterized protein n=1 Tax=Apiospora kogelbergensis TaxID=1337665 RepID=UPI0031322BF8
MASSESASAPLYVVTSLIWDDQDMTQTLQLPEVYRGLDAANDAAKAMMTRYSKKCKLPSSLKKWEFNHEKTSDGYYFGFLGSSYNGHIGARVKVFKASSPSDSLPEEHRGAAMKGEEDVEIIKDEDESVTGDGPKALEVPEESKVEEDDEVKDEDEEEVKEEEEEVVEEKKPKPAARPKMKKTAVVPATHRKKIPDGKPDCLKGLKLLFTGTFETMDRKTSVATAYKYGAEVINKLEDTDYIVLGTRAGPKKLQTINENELETITEEEFFQILENGVSQEKRDRMAAKKAADEDEEPEEEEEKPANKRKGPAASASSRKRTKKN